MDVSLSLTHDCNLGCTYCFAGEKSRRRMTAEVRDRALELAFADGSEEVQLSFFGGEPLLEWPFLVETVGIAGARAEALGRALTITLTTNGTLLDEERVRFLVEHRVYVGLSIDGVRAAHEATRPTRGQRSSFDGALRGLRLLVRAGARLETISVIDPANVRRLAETVRFLVDEGIERIALNPHFGGDFSDEDLAAWEAGYRAAAALWIERLQAGQPVYVNVVDDKLVTQAKGGYEPADHCAMGHGAVAVAPSGNLYPCERMVEEDRAGELRIGDVFRGLDRGKRMILDAQKRDTYSASGAPYLRRGPTDDVCDGCGVLSRCMSFCACANRAETGSIGVPGGLLCWHEQMAIRVADEVGAALWRARDRRFVQRVYGAGA